MPRFTVVPVDPTISPVEIEAPDAAGVLRVITKLDCGEADILENDA